MKEVATFFRHRANDPGETYQLEIGSASVSVYSPKPMQSGRGKFHTIEDLRAAVANEGGGGFLVSAIDEGTTRKLTVTRIGSKSTSEPQERFVLLSPGGTGGFRSIDGKSYKVPLGSHAIVPVDAEAMSELETFIGHLSWLSLDLEALVLNAIRRPSLETRLSKVESRVFGQTAEDATRPGSIDRPGTSNGGLLKPKVFRAAMVVLLILLLGAVGFVVYRARSIAVVTDTSGTTRTATNMTGTDTSDTGGSHNPPKDVYVKEAKELFQALRENRKSNGRFSKLYDAHFTVLNQEILTDEQIKALFSEYRPSEDFEALYDNNPVPTDLKDPGAPKTKPRNRPFLCGMIKLGALKLEPDQATRSAQQPFLLKWYEYTKTKAAFTAIGMDKIESEPDAQKLLGVLACRLNDSLPTDVPSLKVTKTDADAFILIRNGQCSAIGDSEIENGLKGLTTFVKNHP